MLIDEIRTEVKRFAELMEKNLRKNDHKTQWRSYGITRIRWFFDRLNDEVTELDKALSSGSAQDIADEAADVSNFAMMIADICLKGDDHGL